MQHIKHFHFHFGSGQSMPPCKHRLHQTFSSYNYILLYIFGASDSNSQHTVPPNKCF